jgi:RimJ/RimL family protein N-acetyltransferase
VTLEICLLTSGEAERVARGRQARVAEDRPWADEYPLEGDGRACLAYLSQLRSQDVDSNPFGYHQVVLDGIAVGGIGFHGPPQDGVLEVGYGVVPAVRGRGVASGALRLILGLAVELGGIRKVYGRTTEDNVDSQRVMLAAGMTPAGRDRDLLNFELELG